MQIEQRTSVYKYIISEDGTPLQLHMMGAELALDSHFDEYVLSIHNFEALAEDDEDLFAIPEECSGLSTDDVGKRPVSLMLASLVPQVRHVHCFAPAITVQVIHCYLLVRCDGNMNVGKLCPQNCRSPIVHHCVRSGIRHADAR